MYSSIYRNSTFSKDLCELICQYADYKDVFDTYSYVCGVKRITKPYNIDKLYAYSFGYNYTAIIGKKDGKYCTNYDSIDYYYNSNLPDTSPLKYYDSLFLLLKDNPALVPIFNYYQYSYEDPVIEKIKRVKKNMKEKKFIST